MWAISVWLITLIFWGSGLSCAAGPYTDSAHGDSSIGVLRNSLSTPPEDYAQGNCAHCHEQHSSIGGSEPAPYSPAGPDVFLLFSDNYIDQTTCFCFDCHKGVGSHQNPPFNNYNYSYRASRDTSITCPADILEALSQIVALCTAHRISLRTFATLLPAGIGDTQLSLTHVRPAIILTAPKGIRTPLATEVGPSLFQVSTVIVLHGNCLEMSQPRG